MADFRKLFYAFALVAVLVGLTIPANAQNSPVCSVSAVPTQMRSESYTDLMGDIVITCTGGIPTTIGQPVPALTFTVSTSGIITSKITDATPANNPTAFTEALLIVDGPNTHATAAAAVSNPVLACGSATAPYDTGNLGVCTIVAQAAAAGGLVGGGAQGSTYNGTAAHPNVFQGRLLPNSGGTGIQFIGVPFDAPAPTDTIVLRITNIRINSVGITGGSVITGGFNSNQVQAQVSITTPSSVSLPNVTVTSGLIRNGLLYPPSTTTVGPYPQCGPISSNGGSVKVTEGFASSFKTKNWAAMQANGIPNMAASDLVYAGTAHIPVADLNQNVPGALYSTESGFEFNQATTADPAPNAPLGRVAQGQANPLSIPFPTGLQTGIDQAGTVTNGTRLAFEFTNVPVGSNATIPNVIPLQNAQIGSGNAQTGIMVAVTGFQATDGSGGTLVITGSTALSETGPTFALYEVLFADQNTIEQAVVPVTIAPTISLSANPPINGSPQINVVAQASAGFAPYYAPASTPNPGVSEPMASPATATALPIARFINNQTAAGSLFSFTKCACDLLFPWVVGDSTFTTSIVVDNTSLDPGTAFGFNPSSAVYVAAGQGPQSGRVTFWYYGTTGTTATSGIDVSGQSLVSLAATPYAKQQTTVLTPPGSYVATIVSPSSAGNTPTNGLKALPGNFAGYVIAQSEFRYCHGVAAISAAIPGFGTQTYIGLVMDNNRILTLSGTVSEGGALTGIAVPVGQLGPRTTNLGENFDQ